MSRRVIRLSSVAFLVTVLGLSACSDDDDASSSAARYCDILEELDEAGAEAFGQLDADATEAEYDAVQKQFVEDNQARFNDLIDAAPASIRDDLRSTVEGATGDGSADEAASTRVSEYDAKTCRRGDGEE